MIQKNRTETETDKATALFVRHILTYLVKWPGYTEDHNTWEPEENCENSRDLIDDFHKKNPSALRKLRANIFAGLVFKPYENLTEPSKTTLSRLEVET